MNYGKAIRLFYIEGIADGRWMCELSNWTEKALMMLKFLR